MFEFLRSLFRRPTTTFSSVIATTSPVALIDATQTPVSSTLAEPAVPVFLDTETTGLNQDGMDEVLEIAIIDANGRALLDTLVRPVHKTGWPQAQAIHGISPQDVANAPTWKELLPQIATLCAQRTVVSYNAPFDTSFFPAGFFTSVVCAMRRYAELSPGRNGWMKLSEAAVSSGYAATSKYHRALEDAQACRHIWLIGIPALERVYPSVRSPHVIAKLALETGERIPMVFKDIFPEELRFVTAETQCKLWTKEDREDINVYRPETLGGSGKIAILTKADNPELTKRLSAENEVKMWFKERTDDTLMFEIVVSPIHKKLRAMAPAGTPAAYSPIDDDISKCFIAYPSGMCDAIGTWEDFHNVERELAKQCKTRGGRYYKSKAKGAKFAIIFSPHAQTVNEVCSLRQDGYKVTTFDRVIAYFGLEEMWDCPRYVAYVESLKINFDA